VTKSQVSWEPNLSRCKGGRKWELYYNENFGNKTWSLMGEREGLDPESRD
jgi:hypothetical protein